VVTYNSNDVIGGCLRALEDALRIDEGDSVIVVDNSSSDDTIDCARAVLPAARIVSSGGNIGYAAAINKATDLAPDYDYLLILNPDTVVAPDSVEILVGALSRANSGIAVPSVVSSDGRLAHSLRREPSLATALSEAILGGGRAGRLGWGEVIADPHAYEVPRAVDWASGAALLVSRECQRRVGRWDENYLLYSEETDFMLRARDAGLGTLFVPDAVVTHRGGESGTSPFLWSLLMVNRTRFYATRHGHVAAFAFRLILFLGEAARAIAGRQTSRAGAKLLFRPSSRVTSLPQ
jgi:GT2 family glycosyltransferase